MNEYVIGYDVREFFQPYETTWTQRQKETFLFADNVVKPLSIDVTIWNTVFDNNQKLKLPSNVGWRQSTWSDLTRLKDVLQAMTDIKKTYWLMAFSQYVFPEMASGMGINLFPVSPSSIDPAWQLIGYDVAELTLLSGLMNMGYSSDQVPLLRSEYSDYINKYHLFDNVAAAQKFAEWSNNRDKGHGPFYVYGLYRVAKSTS